MQESQNIEFKESWRDEYLRWICGFANAQGGTIYIGIEDNGHVCGVNNAHRLLEDIPNKIVNTLGIVADVNLLNKEGKDYIEIIVSPSNVPISYQGIYFYRSGATKQELKGTALQQFILKKMGRSWDDIPCEGSTINDIDPKAIKYFLKKAIDAQRMPIETFEDNAETVLENLNLFDNEGKLKNAALLLFGKNPAKFFVGAEFKIGRFGKKESDLMFQDVVEGNIIQMADSVIEILKSKYLISPIHYEGLQRIEPLEFPEDAFREAIFNAIIHKQYAGVPIQMKIYDNSVWLWNNGDLPEGFTIETLLGKHTSKPRNGNIANVFYKAGFIESWGRGIDKIRDGFNAFGFPEPEIKTEFGGVSIVIQRKQNLDSQTLFKMRSQIQAMILEMMERNPLVTQQSIANELGVSRRYVAKIIEELKEKELIKRIGASRYGGKWQVIKKN